MCFSKPKPPPQAPPPPMPAQEPKPLGNKALETKRKTANAARKGRQSLRIPIGGVSSSGGLGIPRG